MSTRVKIWGGSNAAIGTSGRLSNVVCQTVVDLPAPRSRRAVFQCVRRRSLIAAITALDEFVRARLPTALRARKGAGCVRCRTRRQCSAYLICTGGVRSCAAADCSARPKGRWMRTLPHTTAMLCLLDLHGRRSLVCGCRLLCAPERALDAYAAAHDRTALPT